LNCERIRAVVIGGGKVGTRKALALHEAGADVLVIAPQISIELCDTAESSDRLHIERREYAGRDDLFEAELVFAATDSPELNASIANDATALRRLVNVASDGNRGSFTSMAIHRAGRITVGVTAGGVPAAAALIRDEIRDRFDDRYQQLIDDLALERGKVEDTTR
jgi:precorrin-2 dehydrogenase/sirohydrochlorin ferrochelatase